MECDAESREGPSGTPPNRGGPAPPPGNPPSLYIALMGQRGADDTEESALVLVFSDRFHSG